MKHIKRNFSIVALSIFSALSIMAEGNDYSIGQVVFTSESGTYGNVNLAYRKAVINNDDADTRPALVLYMHGGSSKGSDNTTQMGEKGIDSIANYLSANRANAVFIVPQCPSSKSWGGQMNYVVKSLIDAVVKTEGIDTDRIYIFGGSMGGTAAWGLVSAYPELFTAAMPVAGNPSKAVAENVAKTPIYTVMGTADVIMKIDVVDDFVSTLLSLGCDAKLDVVEGWTHEETCIQSYTADRLGWVFAHTKTTSAGIEDVFADTETVFFTIDGKATVRPTSKGLYIERCGGVSRKVYVR